MTKCDWGMKHKNSINIYFRTFSHQEKQYHKKKHATSGNFTYFAVLLNVNVKVTDMSISMKRHIPAHLLLADTRL